MVELLLTLPDLNANLALDEALVLDADAGRLPSDVLRIWEPEHPAIVLGRGSRIEREVDRDACAELSIPIHRRISGGAAIVTGPRCLMYALILHERSFPQIKQIDRLHELVMRRHTSALGSLGIAAHWEGTCDLTWEGRKVSGNSVRCLRQSVLYHGTFLYGMGVELIERCLLQPPRQPAYRQQRNHREFVGTIPCKRTDLEASLRAIWQTSGQLQEWPSELTEGLASAKYAHPDWIVHARDVLRRGPC